MGQRAIHSRQTGSTRATGVCCSITSLTSTAQASTPGRRHGRSRAAVAYQSTIASPASRGRRRAGGGAGHGIPVCRAGGAACRAGPGRSRPLAFAGVLHPVGTLPAAVYWRRRLVVLVLLLAVLGGGAWLG